MTTYRLDIKHKLGLIFIFVALVFPSDMMGQRMRHAGGGGSRGGGGQSFSRPSHTTSRAQPTTRPSINKQAPSRSINGGSKKTTTRDFSQNKATTNRSTRPITSNRVSTGQAKTTNRKTSNIKNKSTDRSTNKSGNKIGNKTHIGNNNVNVNINNSRNTHVRASSRHYSRPPYRYGGYGYYCHRPYYYHPYRPFYWGPVYHPWGFFVATMATTAIIVSITNDDNEKEEYNYENGTYYMKTEDGFVAVQAPVGAEVPDIPKEAQKVEVNETNNYYYGGAFYEKNADGYIVVPATAGTIVPGLPEGGEEVKIGEVTYVQFGETYYQPIQVDGKDMYEIVEVKAE